MEYILGFGSAHRAMKAESALKAAGLKFRLLPAPASLARQCGLVIKVAGEDLPFVLEALRGAGLDPKSTYRIEGEYHVKV